MSFSALDSQLLGGLTTTVAMAALFSDENRIAMMLHVETALARSHASFGLAPEELATALERVRPADFDLAALGRGTALSGVPVIPFLKALQALIPKDLEPFLHRGATTQDIVDSSLVLIFRDGLSLIAQDLAAILTGLSAMAEQHRATPCVARSYGQQAAPISFGFRAAVWLAGVADAAARLPDIRRQTLVTSYGGPVGSLAALGDQGPAVLHDVADRLGLATPTIAWHTRRGAMISLGGWLAQTIGALSKMASDVVLLSSTEVGEVAEPHVPGRGGSSAMPHKRNPVSSTVILAAAQAAGGLAGSLYGSMAASQERPAGAWHAEWHALPQLFGLAAGALHEARSLAEGLTIDAARMAENLDLTRGLIYADAAAAALSPLIGRRAAHDLVEAAAADVRDRDMTLLDALLSHPECPAGVTSALLATAFDPGPAVAAASAWTPRAIAQAAEVAARLSSLSNAD